MKSNKKISILLILILVMAALTACGGASEEAAATEWPADYAAVPAFTASPIENLEIVDDTQANMEFQNVSQEQLDEYANTLVDAGFIYEPVNGNVYTKVDGDVSYAVGWNVSDTTVNMILLIGTAEDGAQLGGEQVVVQWPVELDGITPLQGYTPNSAMQDENGLVTVDYSGVTEDSLNSYREALASDGFAPYDAGIESETYARIDEAGMSYLVVINPQDDVEGHLQISGIIAPAEQ